ncbi:MAG: hypothetical protein AAGF47_08010 [Planctomycetota bacterium]
MSRASDRDDRVRAAKRRAWRRSAIWLGCSVPVLFVSLALFMGPLVRTIAPDLKYRDEGWYVPAAIAAQLVAFAIVSVPSTLTMLFVDRWLGVTRAWEAWRVVKTGACRTCRYPLQAGEDGVRTCTECGGRFGDDGMRLRAE